MARKLPWKRIGPANPAATPGTSAASPVTTTSSTEAGPALAATPSRVSTPKESIANSKTSGRSTPRPRISLSRQVKSPSTSPPPEPVSEEFMIDGLDQDDKYRMVEDEFLATAGNFTKHLHAAEYQRLKQLAKSQNMDTIQSISRPVTTPMTGPVKRHHSALKQAVRQHHGVQKALGKRRERDEDSDHDEKPWAGTSLRGLMESPRKERVVLSSLVASQERRDAAGSSNRAVSPQGDTGRRENQSRPQSSQLAHRSISDVLHDENGAADSESDDDLDGSLPTTYSHRRQAAPEAVENPPRGHSITDSAPRAKYARSSAASDSTSRPEFRNPGDNSTALDDDLFTSIRKRRQQRHEAVKSQASSGAKKRESSLDSIPFF